MRELVAPKTEDSGGVAGRLGRQANDPVGTPQGRALDPERDVERRPLQAQQALQAAPEGGVQGYDHRRPGDAEDKCQNPAPDRVVEVDVHEVVAAALSGEQPHHAEKPAE